MPHELHGRLSGEGRKFAVVVSRFNEFITSKLLAGATDTLREHGCDDDDITCVHVPGAFEIPMVAQRLASSGQYHAIICLGCVIRGQTPHFEFVAGQAAAGIARVGLKTGVPATFGVITADSLEQAIDRAGSKLNNKGAEAALCAIELADLIRQLPSPDDSK